MIRWENEMMRYLGIFIMAGSLCAGGFYAAQRLRDRMSALLQLRRMVYHLKNRMLYTNEALPEAMEMVGSHFCERKAERDGGPGRLFCNMAKYLEQDPTVQFSEIWKRLVEELTASIPFSAKDRANLLELGQNLGDANRDMQERTILLYLEQTDDSLEILKTEIETKAKLYRSLGVAAGLFVTVVLF